ncbi:unnamed protein product [Rotaria magnacalcarata]|uniref:Uncharacterized protein n=1 Tax=Rotaria magnacalcarata TaxID=392030 RepID=A0A816NHS6_9BILA|nr:unnamed protein product [Rotaria magnacalcarata]
MSYDDEQDKKREHTNMFSTNTSGFTRDTIDINGISDNLDIDALIGSSNTDFGEFPFLDNEFDTNEMSALLNLLPNESNETGQLPQSNFVESNDQTYISEPQSVYSQTSYVTKGYEPEEPNATANSFTAHIIVQQQEHLIKTAARSRRTNNNSRHPSSVEPFDYLINSNGCQPCTTVQMPNNFAYQQQLLQSGAAVSKKIEIKCEPRSKYRPRTQNESKNSAHYVRCEEGVKPEYPTISIPMEWNFQSDVNLIEVALVGIDQQAHPYALDNKTSSNIFDDSALIFKPEGSNALYFRVTKEDFLNKQKTFMIEIIKSKQDNIITKYLIRARQLEHSMIRFTRHFQVGKGDFQCDEGSTEYSCIMSEAYGDVDVEHMGPRYGPMGGQEMVYAVLKGRILKNDLKIEIVEYSSGWNYSVQNFTKNGNIIYFLMPAFPHQQYDTMTVNIIIYYRGLELYQSLYLYKGSLDQELASLHLNDSGITSVSFSTPPSLNVFELLAATDMCPTLSRKGSTLKSTKRLRKT